MLINPNYPLVCRQSDQRKAEKILREMTIDPVAWRRRTEDRYRASKETIHAIPYLGHTSSQRHYRTISGFIHEVAGLMPSPDRDGIHNVAEVGIGYLCQRTNGFATFEPTEIRGMLKDANIPARLSLVDRNRKALDQFSLDPYYETIEADVFLWELSLQDIGRFSLLISFNTLLYIPPKDCAVMLLGLMNMLGTVKSGGYLLIRPGEGDEYRIWSYRPLQDHFSYDICRYPEVSITDSLVIRKR